MLILFNTTTQYHHPMFALLKTVELTQNLKLEIKSNTYTEALQYWQNLLPITIRQCTSHIYTLFRKSQYVRRKSENLRFWYFVLCSGAIWRRKEKFEHGCTTINYRLHKASNFFLKLHSLIAFRLAQLVALPCAFCIPARTWQYKLANYFIWVHIYNTWVKTFW